MRAGRALRADGRRCALRRFDGRPPGPLERLRPREDRPDGGRPRRALRVPPRLPGERARAGLHVRAVGPPAHAGLRPRDLRARGVGEDGAPEARAAVLVLLPLQRLQQHARGRLGDDPARLRRRRRGGCARRATGRGRLQLARGCREGGVGRRQARDRRRYPSRRLSGRRLAREQVHRRPVPRQLGRGGGRLRRHAGTAPRAHAGRPHDPERSPRPPPMRSRGSRSRDGGASCRRPSSTGRPAPT